MSASGSSAQASFATEPSTPASSIDEGAPLTTLQELERLNNIAFTGPSNASDGEYPEWFLTNHVAHDFLADFDGVVGQQRWDEHVEMYRKIAKANPNRKPEMVDVLFDIDESNGRADAFCRIENAGRLERAKTQTMARVTWQRRGGIWKLWRITTMRGSNTID